MIIWVQLFDQINEGQTFSLSFRKKKEKKPISFTYLFI